LQQPAFIEGNFDTHFINRYFTVDKLYTTTGDTTIVAAIAAHIYNNAKKGAQTTDNNDAPQQGKSNWQQNRKVLR